MLRVESSDFPADDRTTFATAYMADRFACDAFLIAQVEAHSIAVLASHGADIRDPGALGALTNIHPGRPEQPLIFGSGAQVFDSIFSVGPAANGRRAMLCVVGQTTQSDRYLVFMSRSDITSARFILHVQESLHNGLPFHAFVSSLIAYARDVERSEAVERTVNALGFGTILADEALHITFANRCALQVLSAAFQSRQASNCYPAPKSQIAVMGPNERKFVMHLLAAAQIQCNPTATFWRQLPNLVNELPFYVTRFTPSVRTTGFYSIVFPDPSHKLDAAGFLSGLGLTRSESLLAARIAAGQSLKSCSYDLGLSETSARTYLKRVFSKLGVSRQAELVSIVARMTVPVSGAPGVDE